MPDSHSQLSDIRRLLRWFVGINILLFLLAIGVGSLGYIANGHRINDNQRVAEENTKARLALCALRRARTIAVDEARDRIRQSREFLKNNPHGGFGFTPKEIRRGIRKAKNNLKLQQQTVSALSVLACPHRFDVKPPSE